MKNFNDIEETARKIWKKNKKEIENAVKDDKNKKLFSFLEGPPTANARPAIHHLEVRTFKDIINKFKFMQGFSVPRKAGWDCHGLPVEVQVEKKLGLNSKKQVIDYGIKNFTEQCEKDVFSNIEEWNKSTEELNYWVDLKNPYITLEKNYIESVWWALKQLYDKKLLYEGYKVVPYCPRCETPLSSHEVAQGYKDVNEDSVYIAFKIKDENTYFLAWTTTPWTLPGNVALALGSEIKYAKVELEDGDKIILAKEKLELIKGKYKLIKEYTGKELEGIEYDQIFNIKELKNENSHKTILADFVTTEDGTGIVHTAVMYGEEDYNLGIKNKLPVVHTVGNDGKFLDIVKEYKGRFVKGAEKEIIEDLKKKGILFKKEKITHSYPFCWRCDSPLLYYAINSWFIKVKAIKKRMVELNKEINWEPAHIKDGRFGKWLENAKDWALSRSKFWGTPLPVWRCECEKEKVIGSIKELEQNATKKIKNPELHKPNVDEIKLKCECGKEMSRIPDVIDCWFDSGAASFAQFHYPFENKEEFEKRFPYDFISEAIDQTRGWFYTLHVIATALFDKPAYKNVICAGHVVDEKGEKMSKSKGNVIKPNEIIEKTGIDAVRLQFCTSEAGNQKRFSYELMKESVIPFLNVLINTNQYYKQAEEKKVKKNIEDKWILSKLNSLIEKVTKSLEEYKINEPYDMINEFVVKDFSRAYIQMTRDREDTKEILKEILEKISLLLAPYIPYTSEYIYQNFSDKSVHLSKWPKSENKKIDKKLEKEFERVLLAIEAGLRERDKQQIGLKQPLAKAKIDLIEIDSAPKRISKEAEEIIKKQLNVKDIKIKSSKQTNVEYDTKITPELEAEGFVRELMRKIQQARKEAGLIKKDKIKLEIVSDLAERFKKFEREIKEKVNAEELSFSESKEKFDYSKEEKIKNDSIIIKLKKV